MHYKIVGTACVALLICGGIAQANVDFNRLVASLSYDDELEEAGVDPPELSEEIPAPSAKSLDDSLLPEATDESYEQLDNLLLEDPTDQPPPMSPLEAPALDDNLRSIPELPPNQPEDVENELGDDFGQSNFDAPTAPQAEPQAEPEPYQPLEADCEKVDLQMLANSVSATPANPGTEDLPSVLDSDCSAPSPSAPFHQCGYNHSVTLPCLATPVLPPPADNHALYRTPACYRGLWAGYDAQKQLEWSQHHRHIQGTCDCERKSRHNCAHCQAHSFHGR